MLVLFPSTVHSVVCGLEQDAILNVEKEPYWYFIA